MKFLIGIAFGAVGMWAYQAGKVQGVTGNDQVRQIVSTVQDKVQRTKEPQIATPSAAEVAGRPSEPLPRQEPENVQVPSA
jgi:hypothetical protein